MEKINDKWNQGDPYEYFMGRWSQLMAPEFLDWLDLPTQLSYLEIGCGTGALSEAIHTATNPKQFYGIDPSQGFIDKAKQRVPGKAKFRVGEVSALPFENDAFDVLVSGLALNFFPDLQGALKEMLRVTKPKGTLAAYVWDYAGRMDFLRYFWDAVAQLDPQSAHLDEGIRFPICDAARLKKTFQDAGLSEVEVTSLDIATVFRDFEDYWNPFLGKQGPAPSYLASLPQQQQEKIKNYIHDKLPIAADGSITLLCRAIAVKGTRTNDNY